MDFIYVPSQDSGKELIEKGIHPNKIKLFPRGIDIDRFHPSKRNGYLKRHYQIKEPFKLLYVGRVSKEKNLPLLVDVFKTLVFFFSIQHIRHFRCETQIINHNQINT